MTRFLYTYNHALSAYVIVDVTKQNHTHGGSIIYGTETQDREAIIKLADELNKGIGLEVYGLKPI